MSRARSHSRVNAFEPPAERTTFLLKPALGMREDEGTDPASRRGIPSSEELEVVSSLLLSTPASSLLLDMPPLHKGTGHVAEGTRHAAKGTRHAAKGTRHAAEGTRHAAEGTRYAAEGTNASDKSVGQKCGTQVSDKSVGQQCRTKVSDKRSDKVPDKV